MKCGDLVNKNIIQTWAIWISILLLVGAALGYLIAPAQMLSVVGISSTSDADFLVRTLAAAFIAMAPIAFSVRKRTGTRHEKAILVGLGVYMIAGSAVDLHAFLSGIVGPAAVPSVGMRTILGVALLWLAF